MNEVLTNTEIEALLDMFRVEEAHIESPRAEDFKRVAGADIFEAEPVVSKIDLCKPNRFSREHIASLEQCATDAARAIGATSSEKLRLDIACECVGVEQQRFGSLMNALSGPVVIYVLRLAPLEHLALLSISTELLYGAVDRILGGSGRVKNVPTELTAAEYTVADAFVGPALDHICRSMEMLGDTSWEIEARFSNGTSAQILGAHEVAASIYFQVSGDFMLGDMRLVLPHASLEPHLFNLGRSRVSGFNLEPGKMRNVVEGSMKSVDVELGVQLGEANLTVHDLMALRVGDVVSLDTRVGDRLVAPVEGIPKFWGSIGRKGRRLAYRIDAEIE